MSEPVRIQRKRLKGWKMPPNTVYVGRPTGYGNRYAIGEAPEHIDNRAWLVTDADMATRLFSEWIEWMFSNFAGWREDIKRELGGKNLACWCSLDQPCHADVLLKIANEPSKDSRLLKTGRTDARRE